MITAFYREELGIVAKKPQQQSPVATEVVVEPRAMQLRSRKGRAAAAAPSVAVKPVHQSRDKDGLSVGCRVYAKYTNDVYYWGKITKKCGTGDKRSFEVWFDDDDVLTGGTFLCHACIFAHELVLVQLRDIHSEQQYVRPCRNNHLDF